MPIDARPDHVAIAVPDWDTPERRWVDQLGGRRSSWSQNPAFRMRQYRFANAAKLELIAPVEGADSFVRGFLDRFGAQVHHLTLKVPDIHDAIAQLPRDGFEVVDVRTEGRRWREAFLRPSQVGGLVVQVAWSGMTDNEWWREHDFVPEPVPPDAATLLGPQLRHPDLDRAREVWTALGADVIADDGGLLCSWGDAPLTVRIAAGEPAGPVALRMHGAPDLPQDPVLGPHVIQQG